MPSNNSHNKWIKYNKNEIDKLIEIPGLSVTTFWDPIQSKDLSKPLVKKKF
jgi:hypothetical protein